MADNSISQKAVEQLAVLGTEESGTLSPLLKTPHSKNITLSDWNEFLHVSDRNLADVKRVYEVLKNTLPELENYTTEQVAAILTTIQAINTTLGQHQDDLTTLDTAFSKQVGDVAAKFDAQSASIDAAFSAISRLNAVDVAKISVEDTDRFGIYTLKITFNDSSSVSTEFDLPLEAVQIASVNDYVGEDGKRYLEIRFVDENVDPLNIELDEIFNIEAFKKQFVEKLESEHDGQVYAQDRAGTVHLARMDTLPYANSVVKRASDASIIVRENPSRDDEAVHKKYVDDVSRYDVYRHVELVATTDLKYVHVQITFDTVDSPVNSCILTISEEFPSTFGPAKRTETHTVSTYAYAGVVVDTPFSFRKLNGARFVDNSLILSFRVPDLKAASYTVWAKGITSRVTDVSINYSNSVTLTEAQCLSASAYVGRAVPVNHNNVNLWVDTYEGGVLKYKSGSDEWLPVAGVDSGGSSQPYDVATEQIYVDFQQTYLKLTIDNLLDGKYESFQPFDMVCLGSDGYPRSSTCTVTVEAYDSVKMLVYDTKSVADSLCPKYYTSEDGNVYLYFDTDDAYLQVYIRGLVEKCTGARLEIVDALPDGVMNIAIEKHLNEDYVSYTADGVVQKRPIGYGITPYSIVCRTSVGEIQVGKFISDNAAVSKAYVRDTLIPRALANAGGSGAPEVHVGTEAPTGSEVLWLDTDEEPSGGSGGSGGGSKLYHHTVTVYWDYSYEDGPYDESVLCYFFSGSKDPIDSLAEIPLDTAILPTVFDMSSIGNYPFIVTALYKTASGSVGIEGNEFDGSSAYDANWHGFRDKVTEVV